MSFDHKTSDDEIKELLDEWFFISPGANITIKNGEVSVDEGYVRFRSERCKRFNMDELPVKFSYIGSRFDCEKSLKLTSMKNFPHRVGDCYARSNKIQSLKGCPPHVDGSFDVSDNPIRVIDAAPNSCFRFMISYRKNLNILKIFQISDLCKIDIFNEYQQMMNMGYELTDILHLDLNQQQKILVARKWLIDNGYESNAKL